MKILNRNTFTEENVTIEVVRVSENKLVDDSTLIYMGKNCYSLQDLEKILNFANKKDLNGSLNYRVKKYTES